MRRGPKPTKSNAKPLASREPPKGAAARVRDLEKRLAEALKLKTEALEREAVAQGQQAATAEILRVISSSPTDLQPVFDTIVQSGLQLLGGYSVVMLLVQDDQFHLAAYTSTGTQGDDSVTRLFPIPIQEQPQVWRAVLEKRPVVVEDAETEPGFTEAMREMIRARGWRSSLQMPMIRDNNVIGLLNITRQDPGSFASDEIALLGTFADQAVIAIENVRLFNETKEALEQQTATSEILRVIAASPTDVQPVFDTIVESAARLCHAQFCHVLRFDGTLLHVAAHHGMSPEGVAALQSVYPLAPGRGSAAGRSILSGRIEQIPDTNADADFRHSRTAAIIGARSVVAVPMLRDGMPIGSIVAGQSNTGVLPERLITLLQTFADQAVIAIENVRLFTELQEKNKALTTAHGQVSEALEQQTATADILRAISQSPTDVQPVFDAIVKSAVRLCDGVFSIVGRFDGELIHFGAQYNFNSDALAVYRSWFPRRAVDDHLAGRAVLERRIMNVADVTAEFRFVPGQQEQGFRSVVFVPMVRDGVGIGVIGVSRLVVGPFPESQVTLLQTFADQAVIAIENVRLFKELEDKNGALTEALEQQTATSEILQTIAQAQTDVQPVFDSIVRSAAQLCHAHTTAVFLTDGQVIYHPASYGDAPAALAAIKARFPRPLDRETAAGTAILTRAVMQVPDVEDPSAMEFARQTGRVIGFRSLLSVPMLRQREAVGAIHVTRREPGPFSDVEVALLQTFADQAVIAIENVRLFKELEAANRELAAASQHKSEFLANMSHELRTPLNAIIGFSEVLTDRMFGELNEKQEEYLKDIYASGTHLLSLINDILDLSKIEAGRMELELTDFHLPTALDSALTLVRERAGRRNISLQMSVDEQLGEVRADERKIRQVVLNLLSNAIKFTLEGGRIAVDAVPKDGLVEVSVTDTGVGIAPEDQEAIFEEFRQVGTTEKKAEGTGLGLTLCRKFIELHGGRIWVKSQVGVGSTFTFTIPVRRGE